ncbi:MAG TPA: GAF domain-containing protein [Polyangiaceae bacterium]
MSEVISKGLETGRAGSSDWAARLERQLATAQQITHIGSWEWNPATNVVTWSDELYRIYGLEPRSCEITFQTFLGKLHPADRERVQQEVGRAIERGGRFSYVERVVRPDGSIRELDTVGDVLKDAQGGLLGLIGTCRDVTSEAQGRRLQAAETRILEMIATGVELTEILATLVLAIEEQAHDTLGSILLLDGERLRLGVAPHLPDAYNRAIDGEPIGPSAGSCGTAAFRKEQVITRDVASDPLWKAYREVALVHDLRACWSTPIFSSDGRVLGTFALYYREARTPDPGELSLIARATHLAGIAVERQALDDQLRALSARIEAVREDERTSVAREIHDELGQSLTALKMDVAWIVRRAPNVPDGVLDKLKEMSSMTDCIIDQVRRISASLRPGVLDDLGLVAAVEWQVHDFERRTGTACSFTSNVRERLFERELSTAVFRMLQEALTNVARHANARHVAVRLEQDARGLSLEVTDDGTGITDEALSSTTSLGLLGLRERARRLGGTLLVSGAPERGTRVAVAIPLTDDTR